MARRIVEKKESLTTLIPEFGEIKSKADDFKKQAEAKNKAIKKLMAEEGITEKEVEGWQVKYLVSTSDSYDEDAMLEFMKKHKQFAECIKTREYIDEEVLEDLIYHGKLSKNLVASLDRFRTVKETEKLLIKRVR